MSAIHFIGEYQLGNLVGQQVSFLYYFIGELDEGNKDHPLLKGVECRPRPGLVEHIIEQAEDTQAPVVLICENGEVSQQVAESLHVAGFINVFVVKGGVNELT